MNVPLSKVCNRSVSAAVVLSVTFFLAILPIFQLSASAASKIDLTISLDKSEYTADEPISVSLKLKNTGKEAVWINKRFYLGTAEMAKDKRDSYLIVTSPAGEKLVSKFSYDAGYPKSDYFESLEPGKEVAPEWKRNLKAYFDIKEPGTYEVRAVYENTFGSEIGLDTVKDKVTSNAVKIKIVEKDVKK